MEDISSENGQNLFMEIMKKAYEKGRTETGMTTAKMIEDLKTELQNMPIAQSEQI